ncbi:hypothetical protein Tco_0565303 [Tanacetum coccineum]
MNPVSTQQVALDNSLVAPEKRLKIEKCNARIAFSKPQREETYQVTLDALNLSPCYPAFLITAEVLEVYMHQFWNTINKIKDTYVYRFKLDKKKFRVDTEVFHEILQICPRLHNQEFVKPPSEEELVTFIQELGYSGKCDMLSAIHTDQMHQPWRTFAAIINRCISEKTTGLDRLRESRAQILWGFTKVNINHFISKDKTISMRNMINLHIICDDSLLGTLKFISKTQDYQQYGALIPDDMINQDIKDSKAYKTYYDFATGKATPKKSRKYKKVTSPSRKPSPVLEEEPAEKPKRARKPAKKSTNVPTTCVAIRDTPRESVPKKKTPTKVDRGKGMDLLSYTTLLEAAQVKEALQKSKKDSHMLHASGSSDRGDSGDDGSNDDDSDEVTKEDDKDDVESDANEDKETSNSEKTDSDEDENLNVNQKDDEEEEHEEEYVRTPDSFKFNDDEEEYDELYKDVDVKSLDAEREKERKGDAEMTDADKNVSQERSYEHVVDDAHVTLITTQKTEGSMQSSSVSFDFVSKFLNLDNVPPDDNKVASMMNVKVRQEESSTLAPPLLTVPVTAISKTTTVATTTVPLIIKPFSSIPQITTPTPVPITEPTTSSILVLLDFASLFGFDQRVSALEQELSQIENLTQEHLVGTAFNLLKGTCKSRVELEYHFEECYKVVTDKLDWTNPEGHEYPFNLSKPLTLIEDQGHQVVPANYFFNNDLDYLKVTHVKVVKKYDYGYLDEIIIRREDQQLYKFVEGDLPRLNLRDIEDMLLLLVQK